MGVYIILSLPNGTSCTAEMDQLYSDFKPRCTASTIPVAGRKMDARIAARKKREATALAVAVAVAVAVEMSGEESSDSTESVDKGKRKRSACHVSLGNIDLSSIVNRFNGDPIECRPFDQTFTTTNIIKSWIAVGSLPMTSNEAIDPKVRHELGEGGAPEEAQKRIQALVDGYNESREELRELGYNADLLDL